MRDSQPRAPSMPSSSTAPGPQTGSGRRDELLDRLAAQRGRRTAWQGAHAGVSRPRVADLLSMTDPLETGPECPNPRHIESYVAGRRRGRRAVRIHAHLGVCPACRSYAEGLRLASLGGPPAAPSPSHRPELGVGQVFGLALAGILLLMANTAVVDLLAGTQAASVTAGRMVPAPAEPGSTVVPPVPLAVSVGPAVAARATAAPDTPAKETNEQTVEDEATTADDGTTPKAGSDPAARASSGK